MISVLNNAYIYVILYIYNTNFKNPWLKIKQFCLLLLHVSLRILRSQELAGSNISL